MRGGMLKRRQLLGLGQKRNTKIIYKKKDFVCICYLFVARWSIFICPRKEKKKHHHHLLHGCTILF